MKCAADSRGFVVWLQNWLVWLAGNEANMCGLLSCVQVGFVSFYIRADSALELAKFQNEIYCLRTLKDERFQEKCTNV